MKRSRLLVAALVASAFLFHSAQPLARPDDALDDAPPAVRDAILDADYATAEALLATLLKEQPQRGDLWLLLSARVSVERGALADAEAALARVEHDFPVSGWRPKARLERASLLHQLRRDPEAEAIVAADAAALLADGRRTELVRLVVDLGDARTQPPADPSGSKPDFARAVALYQAALDLDPPKALGNELRLKLGLTAQKAGNAELAIAALTRFLADGGAAAATPDGASARLSLGRAKLAANDSVGARRALEDLADELARTPDLSADLAKSKADALLAVADTWSVPGKENVPLRIAALRRFLDQHPRHAGSWSAAFAVVDGWQVLGRTDDALAALDWILARPDGEFGAGSADEARRQKALASFRRGELLLLQEKAELAAAAFTDCVARDPSGPRWTEAQARAIEAEYVLGEIAARHEDFAAARARHATFIAHHPLDPRVPAMKLTIGDWFEREAKKRLEDAGEKPAPEVVAAATALRREAVAFLKELARSLPGSDPASLALFNVGHLLENDLGDVEAAVETYRQCTFGSSAGRAQQRLAEMTTPSLSIATPRAFTTSEAPFLQLETRNVAEVSVALHHLDLEAYFRKYVGTEGVEQLDLDLIAPDQRLTAKVDGYARWKPLTQELALPLEGAGAWIAVVSAEGRRATTLVLRSDVDIVVKSSRHDVLVYAQDRRTQRPVADVALLIDLLCNATGNGARVQIEGKTGADGIFHATRDELRAAPGIQVLAKKDGSVACSGVSLSEVAAAPALTRRGVVITDRPAYRPGDVVQLRALVRAPRDGRLEVPAAGDGKGAAWQLEVADPAGRVLHHSELPLSPFGSVHDAFALDALAATGTYTVRFADAAGEAPPVAGRFEVLDYRLDRVTLDLDLPRRVWYRGETIELTARALYHFGAPVSDADLTVTLPDGQIVALRTDAEGRATVRFDTREQPAEATLTFKALLPAEAVQAAANAFVATREFDVAVAVDRDVFLAGERFTVRVKTTARDGSPTGCSGRLVVARRDDRGAETKVDEQKLETGKDAAHPGSAELALALEKGGDYVARFEAVDRFGNTVDGEVELAISDDHDRQRMRLLSDRASLEVGEAATVRLVQRAGAGVVLVTWENAFGMQWRLVETNDGTHLIEFVAADALVPGFVLSAAAVRGTKLHTASAPFAVTRALRLSVTPRGAVARPGEETTLDVVATDPLGRPVAAEVSIGVVDEALLRIAGDGTPDLASAFEIAAPLPFLVEGGAGLPTRSSCSFRYDGVTSRIAATVLGEQERALASEKWQQARHRLAENLSLLGEKRADDARDVDELKDVDAAKDETEGHEGDGAASAFAGRRVGTGLRKGSLGGTAIGVGAGRRAPKTSHGDSADTAFFVADLVTGADGRASVTFRMPGQTSRFRITARGITQDTRAATTSASLESRAEFFAELRLPPLLVEGDAPRFLARVFHGPGLTGSADLELTVRDGERVQTLTGRVPLSGAALIDHLFDALPPVALCDAVHLTLKATARFDGRDVADSFEADVPVRPWGIERVDAQGGELTTSATFFLELPKDLAWRSRRLDLLLGPAAHRFLIDDALRRSPFRACDFDDLRPATQADAAAELFGLAAVVDMVRGRNDAADAGDLLALRRRGEGLLARLVATQQKDGGWPWAGAKDSDGPTSALALAALGRAAASGFTVPPPVLDAGLRYGEKAFRDAPAQADELKALLQFGLAWHSRADFGALNRLHRGRATLSTAALAYTGLALAQSGKLPMAAEVAALLEQRAAVETATPAGLAERCSWPTTANTAWNRSRTEMAALALLALEKASPRSASIARGAQYLLAQRPWNPSRAAGFAWAALAGWFAEAAPASDEARVRVKVNDQEVATLRFSGRETGTRVPVKPELLGDPAAKVKVELTLEGRGRPSFLAALRGFTAEVKRHDDAEMGIWRQATLAPPPLLRGRPLPTGFSILTTMPPNAWENAVTQLPLGGRADCEVRVGRPGRARPVGDEPPPLVVEIPIPAGADVLEGSVSGDFRSFVERPGALVFEIAGGSGSSSLRWSLLGRTPGSYRVLPPVVRGAYDADLEAHGDARTLDVLPAGAASKDTYRATPDERLERGKRSFESGDRAGGAAELEALL
ncbi:MAG TPA: MG2 domain-containing protein, partial [Planctomycetota bacterium]|nr:MG2 domain-containing protein [Planctomycetota bacterium]